LGGDFNLPHIEWPSRQITGKSNTTKLNAKFLDLQDELAMEQAVDFHTRGNKTLDLAFTSHPSLIDKFKPLPPLAKADHDIVLR